MSYYTSIKITDLIPRIIQNKIGIDKIRGCTLDLILERAYDRTEEVKTIDSSYYQFKPNSYYLYNLGKVKKVTSEPQIDGLTYTIEEDDRITFNKPIPENTQVTVTYTRKYGKYADSYRYCDNQILDEKVLKYIVTLFFDYLNNTPQDKITEATLIEYINNYKKE